MTMAGLCSSWHDRPNDQTIKSCAMVITEPNRFVGEVHDRMPVVLEQKDFERWERGDARDAAELMKPTGEEVLQKWPVSKRVNSSKAPNDDSTLIERLNAAATDQVADQ
jgi:putative SOS response-associated peptidase YedK